MENMNIAKNIELLGDNKMHRTLANNMSVSNLFDEHGKHCHYVFVDGSYLDAETFNEVSEQEAEGA